MRTIHNSAIRPDMSKKSAAVLPIPRNDQQVQFVERIFFALGCFVGSIFSSSESGPSFDG